MELRPKHTKSIILGGGCFLCMDAIFWQLKGVVNVTLGYSIGFLSETPSLEDLRDDKNEGAEVIQIEYNPKEIAFEDLVVIFLTTHNPTSINSQGKDIGTQYRSIIFYESPQDKVVIDILIKEMQPYYSKPIVTEVKKQQSFYREENRYQSFYNKNRRFGYFTSIFQPRLSMFRNKYFSKLKSYSGLSYTY